MQPTVSSSFFLPPAAWRVPQQSTHWSGSDSAKQSSSFVGALLVSAPESAGFSDGLASLPPSDPVTTPASRSSPFADDPVSKGELQAAARASETRGTITRIEELVRITRQRLPRPQAPQVAIDQAANLIPELA